MSLVILSVVMKLLDCTELVQTDACDTEIAHGLKLQLLPT